MTEIPGFAQLALRAADLADRCEAAGALVAALNALEARRYGLRLVG
jgi:hypothetical protein